MTVTDNRILIPLEEQKEDRNSFQMECYERVEYKVPLRKKNWPTLASIALIV